MSRRFPRRRGDNFICERVGKEPNILSFTPLVARHPPDPAIPGFYGFFARKNSDDQNYGGLIIPRAGGARWDHFPGYTKLSPSTKKECFK